MRRVVSIEAAKDSIVGAWSVNCVDCPLAAHLDALGMKRRACVSGVQTSVQGAVPLSWCDHYQSDSVDADGGVVTVICNREEAA